MNETAETILREVWEQAFQTGHPEYVGLPNGAWELVMAYAALHGWRMDDGEVLAHVENAAMAAHATPDHGKPATVETTCPDCGLALATLGGSVGTCGRRIATAESDCA